MRRFLFRLVILGVAFDYVLPLIDGISFHGNFLEAALAGLFFSCLVWAIEKLAFAVSAFLTITSFGLALLYLIPIWIVGFWVLPALCLKLSAVMMPGLISVNGWIPSFLGGLIMLVVGIVTGEKPAKYKRLDE